MSFTESLARNLFVFVAAARRQIGGIRQHPYRDLLMRMESIGYAAFLLKKFGEKGAELTAQACSPVFTAENVIFQPTKTLGTNQ